MSPTAVAALPVGYRMHAIRVSVPASSFNQSFRLSRFCARSRNFRCATHRVVALGRWLLAIGALSLDSVAFASVVESGHTGIWRSTARSGEGITVEILDANRAGMAWFTYNEDGGQRWAFSLGEIVRDGDDAYIAFRDISTVQGGTFGAPYDASTVQVSRVGSATLRFEDCNRGVFAFDAFGQSLSLEYERLTETMAAGCAPVQGIPGKPIQTYAGQSGVWADPGRRGQGFQLQWMPHNQAGLGWYTFDRDGNQFWLTGVGRPENGKIIFDNLITTRGARFGAEFDSADVEVLNWGRLELELDCDSGTARYQSESFGTGEQPLYLLTRSVPVGCPYQRPSLTDLFDIEYTPIPVPASSPGNLRPLFAKGIADDGTIIACGAAEILRFVPGATSWQALPGRVSCGADTPAFISPDGLSIFAPGDDPDGQKPIMRWQTASGWQRLPGRLPFSNEIVYGMSQDGKWLTGESYYSGDPRSYAWKWSESSGQVALTFDGIIPAGTPGGISSNGQSVVGVSLRFASGFPRQLAIRWEGLNPPSRILGPGQQELAIARVCNSDCSLVFGSNWHTYDAAQAVSGDAWYWSPDGRFGYMGQPEGVISPSVIVLDSSSDGSIVTGSYATSLFLGNPPFDLDYDAWVWTQNTGMVSLRPLLDVELQVPGPWQERDAISLTSDGRAILLSGFGTSGGSPSAQYRAGILRLSPKSASAGAEATR